MKKKIILALVTSLTVILCMACGKNNGNETKTPENVNAREEAVKGTDATEPESEDGSDETNTSQYEPKPMETFKSLNLKASDYVSYDKYKGIEVSVVPATVTDQEIMDYIDYLVKNYPIYEEITDRDIVAEGDVANISYVGKVDGEAFQGGTADNQNLEIGSNSYIDGFEEGLIGVKVGETVDLNLKFPDNYQSPAMSGKDAVFTVTVNKIQTKKVSEFNDEFVNSLGIEDVQDTEAMKSFVNDFMLESKQSDYDKAVLDKVWENAMSEADIQNPPQELIDLYAARVYENAEYYAAANGQDMAAFYAANNYTEESFKEEVNTASTATAKETLLLYFIAEKENIDATDDEVNAMAAQYASNYGYASVDEYLEAIGKDAIAEYIMMDKVQQYLKDNAVVKDAPAEENGDHTDVSVDKNEKKADDGNTDAGNDDTTKSE